jgi:hypothetical protein
MTGAVAAFPLTRQMILVFTRNSGVKDDPPASSTWARQLISYVTILGFGCVLPAGIGVAIGVLAGSATKWNGGRRLLPGRWDWVGLASSADLRSNATLRSS